MSAAERRRRQKARGQGPAAPEQHAAPALPPLPQWRWRTLPVFAALTGGLLFGLWIGIIIGVSGNEVLAFWVPIAVAVPTGFAFSRIVRYWILKRGLVKPRPGKR